MSSSQLYLRCQILSLPKPLLYSRTVIVYPSGNSYYKMRKLMWSPWHGIWHKGKNLINVSYLFLLLVNTLLWSRWTNGKIGITIANWDTHAIRTAWGQRRDADKMRCWCLFHLNHFLFLRPMSYPNIIQTGTFTSIKHLSATKIDRTLEMLAGKRNF